MYQNLSDKQLCLILYSRIIEGEPLNHELVSEVQSRDNNAGVHIRTYLVQYPEDRTKVEDKVSRIFG